MTDQRDGIPFEQRFVRGKVYASNPGKVYVRLDNTHWATTAVVSAEHLPEGKTSEDFADGAEVEVFLRHRHESAPEQHFGSLRWAEREQNPWLVAEPMLGEIRTVRVDRIPRPDSAYAECLKSGLDIRIHRSEVPDAFDHIGKALDVGDTLEVAIVAIDVEQLQIEGSVIQAMRQRDAANEAAGRRALQGGIVARESRRDWRERYRWPDVGAGPVALCLGDAFFAEHLSRWLDLFGFDAFSYQRADNLVAALNAPDHPQRLIVSAGIWPNDPQAQQELRKRLGHVKTLIWLGPRPLMVSDVARTPQALRKLAGTAKPPIRLGQRPSGLMSDFGRVLRLPFRLHDLLCALNDDGMGEATPGPSLSSAAADEASTTRAARLAHHYLERLCAACDLSAALWVEQVSEQRFLPFAHVGIESRKLQSASPYLSQSILADALREQRPVDSGYGKNDKLRLLQPVDSDRVCVVPFRRLLDDSQTPMRHAVVLFHRVRRDGVVAHPPQHYIPGLQAALEAHALAAENANLGAFALIGKNWSAYLHETRQSAHVLRAAVEAMTDRATSGLPVSDMQWQRLRKDAKHLYDVVDDVIDVIRRRQKSRLSVQPLVEHTASLMLHQFDLAGCAFTVNVPDLPLLLALPPIVLDQSLRNLLDNALHFAQRRGGPGATVALRVALSQGAALGHSVLIEVEDNGPGVRSGDRECLFAPRNSSKGRAGTGLGLHFCQALLRQHGGDLLLTDNLRWRSTVFRIVLPIQLGGS